MISDPLTIMVDPGLGFRGLRTLVLEILKGKYSGLSTTRKPIHRLRVLAQVEGPRVPLERIGSRVETVTAIQSSDQRRTCIVSRGMLRLEEIAN